MGSKKIINRVKKLLQMAADSSSPEEAMIAARQARSLMDKHQIKKNDFLEEDGFGISTGEYRPGRVEKWVVIIASSMAELNDCQSIIWRYKNITEVQFRFQGFTSDAVTAKYLHDYLLESCVRAQKKSNINGRSEINCYRLGFARVISVRVGQIVSVRKSNLKPKNGTSLILKKIELVDAHFNEKLKPYRQTKTRAMNYSEAMAAEKGKRDGGRASLDKHLDTDSNPSLLNEW